MWRTGFFRWFLAGFIIFSLHLHSEEDTPRKALSRAIESGDLVKVQSLVESFKVEVDQLSEDYDARSPLVEAAITAKPLIIKYLIEKGACIDGISEKGYSPLVKFIQVGSRVSFQQFIETVRLLIDSGADVNRVGDDGYTSLMAACQHTRCIELVEMFLGLGALIDARAKDGNTAYLVSLRNNNLKAYRLLVSRGADINKTCRGMRPLSVLALEGNIVMAKMLIEETGADINAYDKVGTTPLICAAIGRQGSMIQFLKEKGADINARTTTSIDVDVPKTGFPVLDPHVTFPIGSTALNFADTLGTNAIANILIDLGGIVYYEVPYIEKSRYWY